MKSPKSDRQIIMLNPGKDSSQADVRTPLQGQEDDLETSNLPNPKRHPATSELSRITGGRSLRYFLMVTVIGGIAIAEVIAMIVVYFNRSLPYYQQVLLDAAVMIVIIFPLLYYLSFKPLLVHIQKRSQAGNISQARVRLIQFANTHSWDELMQHTLDEIEALTGSTIGFFHFLQPDGKLFLQSWSTNTLKSMCTAEGKGSHYDVDQAGVWADSVRQRQAVIINDYVSLENRKGTPEGHAPIIRLVSVPIMRDEQVVAIIGVGNKAQKYTANDVELVSTLADFAWDVIDRKRAEGALLESEEKFRTLVDWTYDWEQWIDPQGGLVYISPSCERISGYTPEEFTSDPSLLMSIIHPDDQEGFQKHMQLIHDHSAGVSNVEYRIIDRDGQEHWIDHICRPLFGKNDLYLGRRVSNRDITVRKQTEKEILERIHKETILTEAISSMQIAVARDLHDTIGQNIGYLRMKLDHLSESNLQTQADMKTEIMNMLKAANEAYDLIRDTLAVLRSGGLADPFPLFLQYASQIEGRSSLKINVTSQGEPRPLNPNQVRQLFFVFREALSNIEKHAKASEVLVKLFWDDDYLALRITDNGLGFRLEEVQHIDHYGLKFMQERIESLKGDFSVQSMKGGGTDVKITLPYEQTKLSPPNVNRGQGK